MYKFLYNDYRIITHKCFCLKIKNISKISKYNAFHLNLKTRSDFSEFGFRLPSIFQDEFQHKPLEEPPNEIGEEREMDEFDRDLHKFFTSEELRQIADEFENEENTEFLKQLNAAEENYSKYEKTNEWFKQNTEEMDEIEIAKKFGLPVEEMFGVSDKSELVSEEEVQKNVDELEEDESLKNLLKFDEEEAYGETSLQKPSPIDNIFAKFKNAKWTEEDEKEFEEILKREEILKDMEQVEEYRKMREERRRKEKEEELKQLASDEPRSLDDLTKMLDEVDYIFEKQEEEEEQIPKKKKKKKKKRIPWVYRFTRIHLPSSISSRFNQEQVKNEEMKNPKMENSNNQENEELNNDEMEKLNKQDEMENIEEEMDEEIEEENVNEEIEEENMDEEENMNEEIENDDEEEISRVEELRKKFENLSNLPSSPISSYQSHQYETSSHELSEPTEKDFKFYEEKLKKALLKGEHKREARKIHPSIRKEVRRQRILEEKAKEEEYERKLFASQLGRLGLKRKDVEEIMKRRKTKEEPEDGVEKINKHYLIMKSKIRKALDYILYYENKDPTLKTVHIHMMDLSKDYREVKVKWFSTSLKPLSKDQMQKINDTLTRASGWIRGEVCRMVGMKYAPKISFYYDLEPDAEGYEENERDYLHQLFIQGGLKLKKEDLIEDILSDPSFKYSYTSKQPKEKKDKKKKKKKNKKK